MRQSVHPMLARDDFWSRGRQLAIDPGCELSAWVIYDPALGIPTAWGKEPNADVLELAARVPAALLAVESIASYGMAVGAEVFETCVWVGRFVQRWLDDPGTDDWTVKRVYRRDVKLHLCGTMRAKDTNVRQAIIDRYGPGRDKAVGKKAAPGPLYGMKADCWQALGVALTAAERGQAAAEVA